jgi:cytochrome c553
VSIGLSEPDSPLVAHAPVRGSWHIALNIVAFLTIIAATSGTAKTIEFGQDVAPILAAHCFECHGPDGEKRKAGLRLDIPSDAMAPLNSGGFAIVPGDAASSKLVNLVTSDDPDLRMPPADSNKTLSPVQVKMLTDWIDQGAVWRRHWSFEPLASSPIPGVSHPDWPSNDIDHYILSRLEAEEIAPSPRATKRVLIRRATYDLLGLPPTQNEVNAYLADDSETAYASIIDRLLASPHYGEHWGRHWLDVVRYADSNGADENVLHPHAYRYRNYVIESFNRDLPYDQFVREQISGDLLPKSGDLEEQFSNVAATGFLALGVKIIAEKDLVKKQADIVDEQIDTLGKTFMGLTLGCARCHDHKFDPIPTRDYYALAGIFHSTKLEDRAVETADYQAKKKAHDKKAGKLRDRGVAARKSLEPYFKEATIVEREAESFDRGNVLIDTEKYGVDIGVVNSFADEGNYFEYDLPLKKSGAYLLQIRYAAATPRSAQLSLNGTLVNKEAIDGITGGWHPEHQLWSNEGVYDFVGGINTLRVDSKTMAHIDKLRLIPTEDNKAFVEALDSVDALDTELKALTAAAPEKPLLMAVSDGEIKDAEVHIRGSHNMLGDVEPRHFLSLVHAQEPIELSPERSGREELAEWLTSDGHPLTARVIANRIWGWHFGKGLVSTPDNFGIMGGRPTHPELLDHLALELINSGWSLKALHRRIMMSSTYQMSVAEGSVAAMDGDPGNVLYWKRDEQRLGAESIRDSMLSLAGELDRTVGGPPLEGVKSLNLSTEDMANNFSVYEKSTRRSVYLPVIRTAIYDLLTLYDFPNSNNPVGRRAETTVPTQALMMMNSDFVAKQAESIVSQLLSGSSEVSEESLINQLYLDLLIRPADADEIAQAREFLQTFQKLTPSGEAPDESVHSAWSNLCHVLLMSNEFIYIY